MTTWFPWQLQNIQNFELDGTHISSEVRYTEKNSQFLYQTSTCE